MKIIHCADLHLDSKMSTNLSREQAKERRNELLRTFAHMVDFAAKNDVRVIMIAGDMFDTRNVSVMARNTVRDLIVSNPKIDFIYLRGNHDNDNFLSKLEEIPSNLKLFNDPFSSYTYGKITISGLALQAYHSLVLSHDTYNIVMMHGQIGDEINLNELKNKNIDYLALGHVHSYQSDALDARGTYCYSGCLEGRGFDECGDKGFVLLDIDEKALTAKMDFQAIASRTLHTLSVDVTGVESTNEAAKRIEAEINKTHYPSRSLIKIVLTGEIDVESELSCDYLQEMFLEYFYYIKIEDATKILVNFSDYEKDESLRGEFIRMVMAADLDEAQKTEIIRCGFLALSGEEI